MLYRIYTENTGVQLGKALKKVMKKHEITGFFVGAGMGVYNNKDENSIVIEIASELTSHMEEFRFSEKIAKVAEEIRKLNKQKSVLLVEIPTAGVTYVTGMK